MVFWIITSCNDVVGHHRFRGPHCLRLQGEEDCDSIFVVLNVHSCFQIINNGLEQKSATTHSLSSPTDAQPENSMEQRSSWETDSYSTGQEITHLL